MILGLLILNNAFADLEPGNNTMEGAEPADINTTLSGTVIALDYDYYALNSPADGNISFSCTSDSPTYTIVQMRDALGNTMASLTVSNTSGELSATVYQLAAGIYYLVVLGNDEASYSVSNSLVSPSIPNDTEPNGDATVALPLASDITTSGHIGYYYTDGSYDVADFYQIEMPEDGDLTIQIDNDPGNYIVLNLYDDNGTSYINGLGDEGQPGFEYTTYALESGTYYIRVSINLTPDYCGYHLSWTSTPTTHINDIEPNDSPETATLINLNETNTGHIMHRRHGGSYDLADFYKVELPENGSLSLSIFNGNNNYINIALYSGDGTTYYDAAYGQGLAGVILNVNNLDAGLYCIKVYGDLTTYYSGYEFSGSFTTSVDDHLPQVSLEVYPNPAQDNVNIHFSEEVQGIPTIRIMNMQGEICFNERIAVNPGNSSYALSISDLPAGIYVVEMSVNGQVAERLFTKL